MRAAIKPTLKQNEVWEAWFDDTTRFIGLGGGAGGGKTWCGAEILLVQSYLHPGIKSFIGREELKRIMSSTYLTFTKLCAHHQIPPEDWKLNGQYNFIEFKNGSRIDLLDLKELPSDPEFQRFGSLEYTNGWIEEAGEVSFKAFDVLKSRIGRHRNAEFGKPKMLLTCNPSQNWLYTTVYKPWKTGRLPKEWKFIQSLYMDNPYTAGEYGAQLETITSATTRARLKDGNWDYNDDPSILIEFDALTDLFSNITETSEEMYMTVDPARHGGDFIVIMLWKGAECFKTVFYSKTGLDVTIDQIRSLAAEFRVPWSHVMVDEDGVGGGIVDVLKGVKGFSGGSSAIPRGPAKIWGHAQTPERYANLRSQCYFELAEAINHRRIAVRMDDPTIRERIIAELQQVKNRYPDSDSKLAIIPKDEMKEALGHSPDFADTLMMRMAFDIRFPQKVSLKERPMTDIEKEFWRYKSGSKKTLASKL